MLQSSPEHPAQTSTASSRLSKTLEIRSRVAGTRHHFMHLSTLITLLTFARHFRSHGVPKPTSLQYQLTANGTEAADKQLIVTELGSSNQDSDQWMICVPIKYQIFLIQIISGLFSHLHNTHSPTWTDFSAAIDQCTQSLTHTLLFFRPVALNIFTSHDINMTSQIHQTCFTLHRPNVFM